MIDDLSIGWIIWAFGHRIIIDAICSFICGDSQRPAPGQLVSVNAPMGQ
jgi:hypothetical protein